MPPHRALAYALALAATLPLASSIPSLASRTPKARSTALLARTESAAAALLPRTERRVDAAAASAGPGVGGWAVSQDACPDGAPLPLLRHHPSNGTLALNEAALHALARLPAPLCVVSAVGPARDGKSTWLNLFYHHLRDRWPATTTSSAGNFGVDHNVLGAGTEGLWMRHLSAPGGARLPGTECASVVLIDTAGLDSTAHRADARAAQDSLALALLASSTVVLNVMRELNEAALERLREGVAHVRGALAPDAFGAGGGGPNLLALLRDARPRPPPPAAAAGRPRAPPAEASLHEALAPRADSLDGTRAALAALFPNRTLAAVRAPDAVDLAELASASGLPDADSPFAGSFAASAQRALGLLQPKAVGGAPLSGELLAAALHGLVAQLQAGAPRGLSLTATVYALMREWASAAVTSGRRAFSRVAPPLTEMRGQLAVALPAASLELLLRNATKAAYEAFLARLASVADADDPAAWLQPYAEQLRIAVEGEAARRRLAHEHAAALAQERAVSRRLRDEAGASRDEIERLLALRDASSRLERWRGLAADLAMFALAAGSAVLPGGGGLNRLGPALRVAPALFSSLFAWRVIRRPVPALLRSLGHALHLPGCAPAPPAAADAT